MNLVETLEASLSDRVAELEQARGKLASCEAAQAQAEQAYSKSTGDFEGWQRAHDAMLFAQRQTDRAKQAVENATGNVTCAQSALERARREQRVRDLRTLGDRYLGSDVAAAAKRMVEHVEATLREAKVLDEAWAARRQVNRELRGMGEPGLDCSVHIRMGSALLSLLERHPDCAVMTDRTTWGDHPLSVAHGLEQALNAKSLQSYLAERLGVFRVEPSSHQHRAQQFERLSPPRQQHTGEQVESSSVALAERTLHDCQS